MKKGLKTALLAVVIFVVAAGAGLWAYDYTSKGLHTRPDMPDNAFWLSSGNGMRAIVVDVPDERPAHKYTTMSMRVPSEYMDDWVFCYPPTEEERASIPISPLELVAYFKIEIDGRELSRGVVYKM